MDGLARQHQLLEKTVYKGEVKQVLDGRFLLTDADGRTVKATLAASCLLMPSVGDQVLAAHLPDGDYLLAVLIRKEANDARLSLEGNVKLSCPSGTLEISAKDGMTLRSAEDLTLAANRLGLSGTALVAAFRKIDLFGDAVEAHLTNLKTFSKKVENKAESLVQQFVSRHVSVSGLDSQNAGSIKQTAKGLFSLQSMFAFVHAKKNVKIDGKQILMG